MKYLAMTKVNHFSESLFKIAQEQKAKSVEKAQELKTKEDEAAKIQKLWSDVTLFMERGWLLHILDVIDKHDALLKKMSADSNSIVSYLESIYQTAKEEASQMKIYRFPGEFQDACLTANLILDRDSAHPNYKFENGFFQVRIDEKKKTACLSNYEYPKLCEIPADIGAIVEMVQRERKRVFARKFDAKSFLKKLHKQYVEILKKEKLSDGSSINIRQVMRRFAKNNKRFRQDEFLIDLSRLVEYGLAQTDGKQSDNQRNTNHEL